MSSGASPLYEYLSVVEREEVYEPPCTTKNALKMDSWKFLAGETGFFSKERVKSMIKASNWSLA